MTAGWISSYDVALRESDPAKAPVLFDLARHDILDRMIELGAHGGISSPEREALDESLRRLFLRETALLHEDEDRNPSGVIALRECSSRPIEQSRG